MTNTTTKSAMDEHNKSKSNEKKKKNKKKMKKNKGTVVEEEQLSVEDEKEKEKEKGKEKEEEEEYYKCRGEVVKRRSKRLKELTKIYREYYWCLIEQLNLKHSHFLWNFPTTPTATTNHDIINVNNNNNNNGCCEVHSCKNKAMALTRFCHSHILSDANQLLYKPCNYPTKCSPSGPTLCMKPILKSAVPSLCSNHLEKAEKHLSRCLRKEGFTGSNKYPLKFNVIVSEFVRQIQSNRKENL